MRTKAAACARLLWMLFIAPVESRSARAEHGVVVRDPKLTSQPSDGDSLDTEVPYGKASVPVERPNMLPAVHAGQKAGYRMLALDDDRIERHQPPTWNEPRGSEVERLVRSLVIDVMKHPFEDDEVKPPLDRVSHLGNGSCVQLDVRMALLGVPDVRLIRLDADVLKSIHIAIAHIERCGSATDVKHPKRSIAQFRIELLPQPLSCPWTTDEVLEQRIDPGELEETMKSTALGQLSAPETVPSVSDGQRTLRTE